ncbi:MAG TPA: hypothetical protein VH701_10270 [Vicinamibacterales bacterium]
MRSMTIPLHTTTVLANATRTGGQQKDRRIHTRGFPALGFRRGRSVPDYFFFICSPQQISECGIAGGHGQPFSYTNTAPHFSQT